MKVPMVNYDTATPALSSGAADIGQSVRNYVQQSQILNQAQDIVFGAISAQQERDAQNKFIDYQAKLANLTREHTTNREVNIGDVPSDVAPIPDAAGALPASQYGLPVFDAKSKALQEEIAATIPASQLEKFNKLSEEARMQASGHVFAKTQRWAQDEQVANLQMNITKLQEAKLYDQVDNLLANSSDIIGAAKAEELRQHNRIAQEASPYKENIVTGNVAGMQEDINKLSSADYKGHLTEDMRNSLVQSAKGKMAEIQSAQDKATALERGRIISNLMIGAEHSTNVTFMDVDRVYNSNIGMTHEQRTQAYDLIYKRIEKGQQTANQMQMVADAISTGNKLNRNNSVHTEAVNTFTAEAIKQNPDKIVPVLTEIMNGTGIVPKQAEDIIVSGNQIDKPEEMAKAAAIADIARRYASEDYTAIPVKDRIVLETYNNMVAINISPQTAFAHARKIAAQTPEERAILNKQYDDLTSKTTGTDNNTTLDQFAKDDEEFNVKNKIPILDWGIPFTGDVPPIPPRMYAQYEDGVRTRYNYNGDMSNARANTWGDVKKNWGVDRTSGVERTMEFPPYRVYGLPPVTGDAIIRKELNQYVAPILGKNIKPEDVILESTIDTPITGEYKLMAPIDSEHKEFGYYPIVGQNLQPITWRMDVKGAIQRNKDLMAGEGHKSAISGTPEEQARRIKARTRYGGG